MPRPRPTYTVSYRILDDSDKTIDVIKLTGPNKAYLKWKIDRIVKKKFGKGFKVHQMKIVEIDG
jgi:hypothetical protein